VASAEAKHPKLDLEFSDEHYYYIGKQVKTVSGLEPDAATTTKSSGVVY
jgi:hypothetical protein